MSIPHFCRDNLQFQYVSMVKLPFLWANFPSIFAGHVTNPQNPGLSGTRPVQQRVGGHEAGHFLGKATNSGGCYRICFWIFFSSREEGGETVKPRILEGGSWNSGMMYGHKIWGTLCFFFGYPKKDPWISNKIAGEAGKHVWSHEKVTFDFVSPIEKTWGLKHRFIWVDRRCWICWMWEHFMYPPGNMASLAIGIPPFRHREFPSLPCMMTAGWFVWRTDTSSLTT